MKHLIIAAIIVLFATPLAFAEGRWVYNAHGDLVYITENDQTYDFGASRRREQEAQERIRRLEKENERLRQQQSPEPKHGSQEWRQQQRDKYLKNVYGID